MPLKKNKRYVNPHAEEIRRSIWDAFLWKTGYYDDLEKEGPPPKTFKYPIPDHALDKSQPSAVWINHSTFLITVDGISFLTDPIWTDRCSPVTFFGPKRRHAPGRTIEELPQIDYVLISHNHYDHLDKKSVLKLYKRFPQITWLVPQGVKKWFIKQGIDKVVELSWWQDTVLTHPHVQFKATAVPAQHFSGRSARDLNQTLWVGWVIECQRKEGLKKFYFVGDTGYNPYDFKKIGMTWNHMDLSLIPIGTYVPRKFMSPVHIEPEHAVQIHKEVNSKLSLGMHWKTFRLSDEPMDRPPYTLFLTLQNQGIDPASFLAVEPGHEINW
jgi:N-acyl-phosphatidylethanolamine-hydrolysing phospholipase D